MLFPFALPLLASFFSFPWAPSRYAHHLSSLQCSSPLPCHYWPHSFLSLGLLRAMLITCLHFNALPLCLAITGLILFFPLGSTIIGLCFGKLCPFIASLLAFKALRFGILGHIDF